MALIHVFNGINEKTTYTFNGRLREHIKGVDWDNSVILRGGYRVGADYEVQPDDIIFIRRTPASATAAAIGVVVGVTALAAGGLAIGYSQWKAQKIQQEYEDAQKAAKSLSQTSQQLPFIKGAQNQAASGQSFPFIMGKTLMTPYRLCPPHYTISGSLGEKQYFNAVLEVAYNNVFIEKVKLGETVIKQFSGSTPQNGSYTWDSGVYYDAENKIEIRQTGAFSDDNFNKKIICTDINSEIPHRHAVDDPTENARIEAEWRAGVVQELPNNAMKAEMIVLFDGLQKYEDGLWKDQYVSLQPQWTNVNNPAESDWNNFNFDRSPQALGHSPNDFQYNTKQQMRFTATVNFTAAQAYGKDMKVRIIRKTPKAESNSRENVYLVAVQTTCYDPKQSTASSLVAADVLETDKRDACCRIGIRVAANANTTGLLSAFSVIAQGCARTWDGEEWSETKTPTSNLAAWELELLTSPHHKPSQYDDTELDLDSFGALYEYCESMGFKADGVINRSVTKKSLLDTLGANSNSALVYNPLTGLIEVAINNGRDYSVALLNSENIISISSAKTFKRKTDGKKVKYVNAEGGYDLDSVIFMRDGGSYDPETDTITETTLQYITSYAHAFKYAWRQMAEELAQPRIITVRAGRESAYYPLYSRVELQHKTLKNGLAHGIIKELVWSNSYLQKIILDGSVTFPSLIACGVIINCVSDNGRGVLPLKVSGTGKTSELVVETTLRSNADLIPAVGNLLSFGELDTDGEFTLVTSPMLITNTEESDDSFILTLVDYNPAIYEYGTLPTYKSNLTAIPNGTQKTVEEQREYITKGEAEALTSDTVQAAVDTVTKGYRFTNIYNVRPVESCLDEIIAKIDEDAKNQSASISMSEEEILLQVQNIEKGLVGLIDIQAGAVTALVEGGGATGQMSLTLNLPVMIDAAKRTQLIQASTEAKVNAVYALVAGTNYYAIKGNASNQAVKDLWDDAVDADLIASQIELQADQIYLNGEVIVNSQSKIKAALIDVENLLASNISVKYKGVIKSANYDGTIDSDGNITAYGSSGWAIDHAGKSDFVNIHATGGEFENVNVSGTVNATAGRFAAGLGKIIAEGSYSDKIIIPLDDNIISGILYVQTGFGASGSEPFTQRRYQNQGLYIFAYNTGYMNHPDASVAPLFQELGKKGDIIVTYEYKAGQYNIVLYYNGDDYNYKVILLEIN